MTAVRQARLHDLARLGMITLPGMPDEPPAQRGAPRVRPA